MPISSRCSGVPCARTTRSPRQACEAISRASYERTDSRLEAFSTVLRSALVSAVTCACTRRWIWRRSRSAPRLSMRRLTAFFNPLTLRALSAAVPPMARRRAPTSACSGVKYQSCVSPAPVSALTMGSWYHSIAALVMNSGRLAVVAGCSSRSARGSTPARSTSRLCTGYSCASMMAIGRKLRTSRASAWASGVRKARWSWSRSVPLAVRCWPDSAPSGLARGTTMTLIASSMGSSRPPPASSRAMISSASALAGSSPCCWPISSTVGRPLASSAATSVPSARVSTRADSGVPRCERPKFSTCALVRLPGAPAPSRPNHWASSALVVKARRPSVRPGVS